MSFRILVNPVFNVTWLCLLLSSSVQAEDVTFSKPFFLPEEQYSAVCALKVIQNTSLLVTGHKDKRVIIWDYTLRKKNNVYNCGSAITSLDQSCDGKYLYISTLLRCIEISLQNYSTREIILFGTRGTVLRLFPTPDRKCLVAVTAAPHFLICQYPSNKPTEIIFNPKVLKKQELFGAFIGEVVTSRDNRFFAVTSQEEQNGKSNGPCHLSIIDLVNKKDFIWQFPDARSLSTSKVIWGANNSLWVIYTTRGVIRHFKLNVKTGRWDAKLVAKAVGKIHGLVCAAGQLRKQETLFVACDSRISYLATDSEKLVPIYEFLKDNNNKQPKAKCIEWSQKLNSLLIGLDDGRIAVLELKKTE